MTVGTFLLISLAGGCGAAGRFMADTLIRARLRTSLPIATVLINLAGSFALGLLVGGVLAAGSVPMAVVGTGVLGGFTTFSTSATETTRLAMTGRPGWSALNAIGTLVGCVALAWLGMWLAG